MPADVINFEDKMSEKIAEAEADAVFHNWFALCVACGYRWIASVPAGVSIFRLQCSQCGQFKSFCSAVPDGYADSLPG